MERRGDFTEQSGSTVGQVNRHLRWSYDANFKIVVINTAEAPNNCQPAKKYGVTEYNVRRWRVQKDCLKSGPVSGHFWEIDRRVCEFVTEKQILSLFLKISLENRGHFIIRVVLYSGQYGNMGPLTKKIDLTKLLRFACPLAIIQLYMGGGCSLAY